MGDKFGSFAFDLAVHPAYLEIQAACPSVVFQAATDDLKCYARDPLDLCSPSPALLSRLSHIGLRPNQSKSAILLAAGQADLEPADVPDGVVLKRDGTLVVGAAVGTDQFVRDHLLAIVRQNVRKIEALLLLDPQSALLLLSGCVDPAHFNIKTLGGGQPGQAQGRTRCAISQHRQQRPRPEQLRAAGAASPADVPQYEGKALKHLKIPDRSLANPKNPKNQQARQWR
jgi:hypothetical protein